MVNRSFSEEEIFKESLNLYIFLKALKMNGNVLQPLYFKGFQRF